MALAGTATLLISLVLCVLSVGALLAAALVHPKQPQTAASVGWIGRICVIATCAALLVCCSILVICFMNGDESILYVVQERSSSIGPLAWLYRLSGLWAGRQGSLLFWAWLISAFNAYVAFRYLDSEKRLDDLAIGFSQVVLLTFIALLFFSEPNMPFIATPASYFDVNGELISGNLLGLNVLLEHWAMAVHPPTLFIGYAGLTLPFAYAAAALALGDDSVDWVVRVNGITSFAWVFLSIGIGLGAVWAYVVLGWGGYWGWDPVENASLLPWLVCTALMHSFTLYRMHGTFKRWSLVCACFAFMFVIVGTFISRSGVVQSVHAFSGDQVSLVLFVALIMISGAVGILTLLCCRGKFREEGTGQERSQDQEQGQGQDPGQGQERSQGTGPERGQSQGQEPEGFFSMEMGYFLNNVILVVSAFLLAYLTLAPALPAWVPLGGESIGADTYNSLARPLGIVLLLIVAVGPLLGWRKTDAAHFWKRARVPAIAAAFLFLLLVIYFALVLLPAYTANIEAGDTAAEQLAAMGPAWYYNGLAIVGFAVASLLIFNGGYLLVRSIKSVRYSRPGGLDGSPSKFSRFRSHASAIGGMLSHASLGIILVGLIGSSMYVTEHSGYLASTSLSQAAQEFTIQDYSMKVVDANAEDADGSGIVYSITLDIMKDGEPFALAMPKVQVDNATRQQKLIADVISSPLQDVFVVFRGMNAQDDFSLEVRINPLISLVWIGFALFSLGTALGCLAKRPVRKET